MNSYRRLWTRIGWAHFWLFPLLGTLAAAPTHHWAFAPIRVVPPPRATDARWNRTAIDRFIFAPLTAQGGRPAEPADPGALLRRLSFDLTGLPPTPAEVVAYVAASTHDRDAAFRALVDRLLASPHYGERWGRWWLDVARYADTNGQDENKVLANAWRYRDWVVRAFNANLSFDQFLTAQIAGDLLPTSTTTAENIDHLIATGFLVLGPKMLAEQDKPKLVMDIVDEQLDTIGKAFLGLTLGCARCHDHKFDPVSAQDYYALAGILKSTRTMENLDFVSKFNERPISTPGELALINAFDQRLAKQTNRISAAVNEANTALISSQKKALPLYLAAAVNPLNKLPATTNDLDSKIVERLQSLLAASPATNSVSRGLHELAASPNRITQFLKESSGTATSNSSPHSVPGKIDSTSKAMGSTETFAEIRDALFGTMGAFALPKDPRPLYPESTRAQIAALEKDRDEILATAPPPAAFALAVAEAQPVNLPVHLRGSHLNLSKELVSRGFLQVINRVDPPPSIDPDHSGRLELARWLTAPENPLTARVIVNRIWQAHFGTGLVRTADNFGLRGETPSHPELLDWLANEFIRSAWDVKAIHRLIVTTAVYQQSSSTVDLVVTATPDPENRYLAYFPRQRLEAEMIRDALLAASDRLDRGLGGSLPNWKNNEYVPADEFSEKSARRTLYLPIVRDRVFDALTIFDFANPSVCSARRTPTVVSHQALFFLNSPLVRDAATALAHRLHSRPDLDDSGRIRDAYQRILNRPASPTEVDRALHFLAICPTKVTASLPVPERSIDALSAFCQTLFAANEFIYRP